MKLPLYHRCHHSLSLHLRSTVPLLLIGLLLGGCAVQRHVDRGRAALDGDDPITARYHLTQAVQMDPSLKRSRSFAADYDRARVEAATLEGQRALQDGQPLTAMTHFERALDIEPGDAAASAGLATAGRRAADERYAAAVRAAGDDDLDAARAALREALELDADHAEAAAALDSLDQPEASQPARYREALAAAKAGRWDASLDDLERVVDERPTFLPARAMRPRVLDRAAEATAAGAEAALAAGDLDQAEAGFERIGRYRPGAPAIDEGLARVHLARAERLERADRPGAALLAYREVLERQPSPDAAEAVARLRGEVLERHAVVVTLTPADDADEATQTLTETTRGELQRRAGRALRIADGPDPAAAAVTLTVTDLDPGEPTVTTRRQQQPYEVATQVPNPEIDRLERRASRLESLIFDLQRRSYYRPTYSYGIGYGVGRSYGYGRRSYGSGFRGFGGFNFGNHDHHRGYGSLRYRSHYGHGYGRGYGSGLGFGIGYTNTYRYHDSYRELRRARNSYEDTLRALDRAPEFVTQTRTEFHPYVLEIHRRTGRIEAAATLPGGERLPVTDTYTATDTAVPEPRPELGLERNPENLASAAEVEQTLLDEAGSKLAVRLSRSLVQDRAGTLRDEAARAGDDAAETEARVAAAVLLGTINPDVGEQLLNAAE